MTHDWFERRVRELEAQLVERTKERDEAKSEIAMIRENCYYACVSKKHAQADLHRVAKDFGEVADHWRKRATELETVARELIDSTDTSMDGPTTVAVVDGAPFDRLKALISGQ